LLSLVLPKGSLERATLDLFDAADLTVRRSSDREYHASIDDPRIERVRFLRPQEIPSYIEQGLFDQATFDRILEETQIEKLADIGLDREAFEAIARETSRVSGSARNQLAEKRRWKASDFDPKLDGDYLEGDW